MKLLLIIPVLFLSATGFSRESITPEKTIIDQVDSTNIYINDGESTELFYYAFSPKDSIEGLVLLLPASWEPVESVMHNNMELIKRALAQNLMVSIPSINHNVILDGQSLLFLNNTFQDILSKYSPPANKIVIGGFSLGGMNAIRYSELSYENSSVTSVTPVAVFGVDPPLDLARLYHSFQYTIQKNYSKPAINEAVAFTHEMNTQLGGSPDEVPDVYVKHSMYSKSEADCGNCKYLNSIPVRIYCDPDIDWQLNERRMDYYDMNAVDQTAMINHLRLNGNDRAEFINCLGKGYRINGKRHPHSWSLIDPRECVEWIMKCLN